MLKLKKDPRRIDAWFRRKAALHAAGHHVIAEHFGLRPVARMSRNEAVDYDNMLTSDERPSRAPVSIRSRDLAALSDRERFMYAAAGYVAEQAWDIHHGRDEFFNHPGDWDLTDDFPADDWQLAGVEPGEQTEEFCEAVGAVEDLLTPRTGPLWGALCRATCALLRDGALGDRRKAMQEKVRCEMREHAVLAAIPSLSRSL
jgi:hypothetical protein